MTEKYELSNGKEGFHISSRLLNKYRTKLIDGFWNSSEAVRERFMSVDIQQFKKMDQQHKDHIILTLTFFLLGDDFVSKIIYEQFMTRIVDRSWVGYESQKIANEDIHSETYRLLLEYFLTESEIEESTKNCCEKYPFIQNKIKWCETALRGGRLAHAIFIMAIIELLYFSSSFATIFWYRSNNLFPGISHANEMIARDEGTHGKLDLKVYKTLEFKLSEEEAHKIMGEAVVIESEFADAIVPITLGMNKNLMKQYVQFVADDILIKAGHGKIYNVGNPFPFMMELNIRRKLDFFRKPGTEYQKFRHGDYSTFNEEDFDKCSF